MAYPCSWSGALQVTAKTKVVGLRYGTFTLEHYLAFLLANACALFVQDKVVSSTGALKNISGNKKAFRASAGGTAQLHHVRQFEGQMSATNPPTNPNESNRCCS